MLDGYLDANWIVMKRNQAMTLRQLRTHIRNLPARAPITELFERRLAVRGQKHQNEWWENHKDHWLVWLKDYNGPGHKNRQNRQVHYAKIVYNRIACPPMLLWLIESAGVRKSVVRAAERAA